MRLRFTLGSTLAVLLMGLSAGPGSGARAQSFDCKKARTPVERAICAEPSLMALDRAVADAFARALAMPQADPAALRAGQLGWLRERDAGCKVQAARLYACLTTALSARLAALAPPAPVATQTIPPVTPEAPAVATVQPAPSIPEDVNPPQAEAAIDRDTIPANAPGDTLLQVRTPGRFRLAARSAAGAAIQLVDMLAGPGDYTGEPGTRDGRIDTLLDVGTYKLRTRPADGATGDIVLTVTPFRDAAPPAAIPAAGDVDSSTLTDLQQRAFWLAVGPDGIVQIDAVGRALADLRLWSGGRNLVPLEPVSRLVEPVRGHPMLGLRLTGKVEPGTYLAIAYAGPPAVWADGAADMPFHLRAGLSQALADGAASGAIGPMGSALFAAPVRAGLFRLELPDPAPASLAVDGSRAAIAANSREPGAVLRTAAGRRVVEVTGTEGQPFRLRAQEIPSGTIIDKPGRWWVTAAIAGAGGDEAPPTALLLQTGGDGPARVVASTAPVIRPGSPWRTQFNVRGPTTLLLESAGTGELTVRNASQGMGVMRWTPRAAPLPAGFAEYTMQPAAGVQGVADLLFGMGPTPITPAAVAHWPADPLIPFGVQTIEPRQRLVLESNTAPGLRAGLLARPVPVALAEGPLVMAQMPGVPLEIPVRAAPGGRVTVSDAAAGVLDVPFAPTPDGIGTIVVPAPDRPRTIVVAWRQPAAARPTIPAPPAPQAALALDTAAPRFLDLRDGERQEFALTVPEGGLYRVETIGRLHTSAAIGTAFLPSLAIAEANGVGENALLQRFLRAGRYRVRVGASASAGHLGLQVTQAPLLEGADLLPGGSVRGAVPAGTGLATPVVITEPGRYRIDLLGQGRTFNARLDDAEGWPLTVPGPLTTIERDMLPGRYRLLVSPEAVDVRVLARLKRVLPATEIVGHGPHPLIEGVTARATWREPAGRDDPRIPDAWTFALAGAATARLTIADGMIAELKREGDDRPVLRLLGGRTPWKGTLQPGRYRLEATSLGRNDRLDYALKLSTTELQPGVPREVAASSQVPFTLAEPGVVSLTTAGAVPLKAVLRDGAGAEIARYGDRGDDWNVAISRLLPAGAYRLDLSPATPPDLTDVPRPLAAPAVDDAPADDSDDDKPGVADGKPAAQSTPRTGAAAADDQADAPDTPPVEVTLSLPVQRDTVPAPAGAVTLRDGGVHRLALQAPAPGRLVLASARSSAALVLAIEREGADGWHTVALDQGTTPVVAVPSDADPAAWRVALWPVDGGTPPIQAAVEALDAPGQGVGAVTLRAVEGAATPVAVARMALDGPALIRLTGTPLLAGGWPGHALEAPDGMVAAPQSATLWLLARAAATVGAEPLRLQVGQALAVPVPAGGVARAASPGSPPGTMRAWQAESGVGQPGIDAGEGMGVATGGALAVGTGPVRIWNAGGPDGLRPRVTALDLAVLPARRLDAPLSTVLPPGSALALTLPDGERRTELVLAPGVAAVAGHGPGAITVWTGETAEARALHGDWTDLVLLNTGAQPAAAGVAWAADARPAGIRPGAVTRQFFGAAGSIDLAVDAPAGARLRTAGAVQTTFIGMDGRVLRGTGLVLPGPGRLTVAYAPGPLALWLETPGTTAWPPAIAMPQALPGQVTLQGPAMALSLAIDTPVLLRARTTAPVILTLGQGAPLLFPAGAVLNRYVAAATVLRIDSAHDGPLSGTLELAADPVTPAAEGLGAPVALAPGGSAVFAFQVPRRTTIGVGVRADPDRSQVRLLAADGTKVAEGAAMLRLLEAGRYLLDVSLPADAAATVIRPAIVGITPRGSAPPPDVAQRYLTLVGLAPKDATP